MGRFFARLLAVLMLITAALPLQGAWAKAPVELKGSKASMTYQNSVAKKQGLSFTTTSDEVRAMVERGELVHMPGDGNYRLLHGVSFPYARPEVKVFIERLAAQYKEATGEKLVVTSLTRPSEKQPWNAHALSVHPTGMAVDLRISSLSTSQQWLESVLLKLESQNLLDVTRERNPPHYHVALFPEAYMAHVTKLNARQALATTLLPDAGKKAADAKPPVVKAAQQEEAPARNPAWPVLIILTLIAGGLGFSRKNQRTPRVQ